MGGRRRRKLIGDLSGALAAGFSVGRARLELTEEERVRWRAKGLEATLVKGWRRGRKAAPKLWQEELALEYGASDANGSHANVLELSMMDAEAR